MNCINTYSSSQDSYIEFDGSSAVQWCYIIQFLGGCLSGVLAPSGRQAGEGGRVTSPRDFGGESN